MLIEQDKVEAAVGQKVTEPGDYDADEQMPGGVDLEKAQNQRMENTGESTDMATSSLHLSCPNP